MPCLCAAAENAEEPPSDCCPMSGDSDPTEEREDSDCCCATVGACGEPDAIQSPADLAGLVGTSQLDEIDGPTTWWSPDLVAALWLVDRIASLSAASLPPAEYTSEVRPDRSNTYLEHATFLV